MCSCNKDICFNKWTRELNQDDPRCLLCHYYAHKECCSEKVKHNHTVVGHACIQCMAKRNSSIPSNQKLVQGKVTLSRLGMTLQQVLLRSTGNPVDLVEDEVKWTKPPIIYAPSEKSWKPTRAPRGNVQYAWHCPSTLHCEDSSRMLTERDPKCHVCGYHMHEECGWAISDPHEYPFMKVCFQCHTNKVSKSGQPATRVPKVTLKDLNPLPRHIEGLRLSQTMRKGLKRDGSVQKEVSEQQVRARSARMAKELKTSLRSDKGRIVEDKYKPDDYRWKADGTLKKAYRQPAASANNAAPASDLKMVQQLKKAGYPIQPIVGVSEPGEYSVEDIENNNLTSQDIWKQFHLPPGEMLEQFHSHQREAGRRSNAIRIKEVLGASDPSTLQKEDYRIGKDGVRRKRHPQPASLKKDTTAALNRWKKSQEVKDIVYQESILSNVTRVLGLSFKHSEGNDPPTEGHHSGYFHAFFTDVRSGEVQSCEVETDWVESNWPPEVVHAVVKFAWNNRNLEEGEEPGFIDVSDWKEVTMELDNRQIQRIKYVPPREDDDGHFLGFVEDGASEVVLGDEWVIQNVGEDFADYLKNRAELGRNKCISLPPGAAATNITETPDEIAVTASGRKRPKLHFLQHGVEDKSCVVVAVCNLVHYCGHEQLAEKFKELASKPILEPTTNRWHHATRAICQFISGVQCRLLKKSEVDLLSLDKNRVILTSVQGDDGARDHVVSIFNGWIFDGNFSHALPLCKESLDACVWGSYQQIGDAAYELVYQSNYKRKKIF